MIRSCSHKQGVRVWVFLGTCLWLNVSTRRAPEGHRILEDPGADLENKHSKGWQTQILPHTAVTRNYRQHSSFFVCFFIDAKETSQ